MVFSFVSYFTEQAIVRASPLSQLKSKEGEEVTASQPIGAPSFIQLDENRPIIQQGFKPNRYSISSMKTSSPLCAAWMNSPANYCLL